MGRCLEGTVGKRNSQLFGVIVFLFGRTSKKEAELKKTARMATRDDNSFWYIERQRLLD